MKPESEGVPMQSPEKLWFLLPHVAFVGCIIALAVLALLPAESMTRSWLGGHVEHFVAYLGTTMVRGLAFRQRPLAVCSARWICSDPGGGTGLFAKPPCVFS